MNESVFRYRLSLVWRESGLGKSRFVAEVCGVSYTSYQKWVNGYATPNRENLARLSRKSGVSVAWLLGETDDRTEDL